MATKTRPKTKDLYEEDFYVWTEVQAAPARAALRGLAAHGEPVAAGTLPIECPYTVDQVAGDWWP